jgi:small-conductance mechanosensitive channel
LRIFHYADLFPGWIPAWAITIGTFAAAIAIAIAVQSVVYWLLQRWVRNRHAFWHSLIVRAHGPAGLGIVTLAMMEAAQLAPLPDRAADVFSKALQISFIALATWVALAAAELWTSYYLRRFKLDADDNLLARKHVTQTGILVRICKTLIIVIAISAGLMTFDQVRQYGVSLLASAGAAGLVAALALQPLLKNIFAGIQLAITQPIRIDDALLIEGEWGKVEEISSTFVVIRIWDWRRLVVPLSYFLEKPFQNWTKEGAQLIGAVMLYLDYSVPVSVIREKAKQIAEASPNWDRNVIGTQVTDFRESTMEVRILASAPTSGKAFDLRCEIREKLIEFLQREHPHALPQIRMQMAPPPSPGEPRIRKTASSPAAQ